METKNEANKDQINFYKTIPEQQQNAITRGRLISKKQTFLLACLPKSGSTWIQSIFKCLPGCAYASFTPTYGAREQEIDKIAIEKGLQDACNYHVMSQHHVKYNINTRMCILEYCIRPIVLTRNIKDNLVSLVDHWKTDPSPMSSAYIEQNYFHEDWTSTTCSTASPLEYATILHGPWILNFYLSWRKYTTNMSGNLPRCLEPIYINYEDFCIKTFESYASLVTKMGFIVSSKILKTAIETANKIYTRKNVGIIGRGGKAFENDPGASKALERLLTLYGHEDLSGIGIH